MKQRIMFFTELLGAITFCVGVGMISIPGALIATGVLIVVACEVNQ
jgi:hypothetical protein